MEFFTAEIAENAENDWRSKLYFVFFSSSFPLSVLCGLRGEIFSKKSRERNSHGSK